MAGYSHLLVAVDFSQSTDAVAERATALSTAFDARMSLIHVVEYIQFDLSSELILPQELEIEQEMVDASTRRLRELGKKIGVPENQQFVGQGSTRQEILRVAANNDVDLIVIGSHGRHGIQLLLGSTANAVLHGAPCDVLAVRVPG
ncbi:universal stress protein [Thiogranum longum]